MFMDSLTQIALGAAVSGAVGYKQLGRCSLIIGAVLATIPDLDVLLPTADALTRFTEHRSFSHSLFVLFPFSFVCFLLLKSTLKNTVISNQRLFWLCCLTLITHPILDSFTSYGTQLFWPLAIRPTSIASIFAADPLYTLPLLIGCIALWRNKISGKASAELGEKIGTKVSKNVRKTSAMRINHIGLILSTGYLLLGGILQTLMLNKAEATLQAKGVSHDKIFISPLYPSLNWWGAIVIDNGVYYDVTLNVLTNTVDVSVKQDLGYDILEQPTKTLTSLNWFTSGFIRLDNIEGQLVATDLRMKTGQLGYAYQFALAEQSNEGWKAITPLRL